jgi:hypothetical protein
MSKIQFNTPLENFWADKVWELSMTPPDAMVQIRKLFQQLSFSIPGDVFETGIGFGYSGMAYGNDKSKGTQLTRNYFNEEELSAARDQFLFRLNSSGKKNSQSCISARMGNIKKGERSQGFCMQTITINYLKNHNTKGEVLTIDMSYRTTELVQKFLADLKFLHEVVIPYITEGVDIPIHSINCHFSTAYLSLMFLPLLYQGRPMLKYLTELEEADPIFWKMVLSGASKLIIPETNYTYKTRLNQHNFFRNKVITKMTKTEISKLTKYIEKKRG